MPLNELDHWIVNKWEDKVSYQVIGLLENWILKKICRSCKSPYLPLEVHKHTIVKRYNKNGQAIYDIKTLTGLDFSVSTRPSSISKIDIFGYDVFLTLDFNEKLSILAYSDPFNELSELEQFNYFLENTEMKSNRNFNVILEESMIKLQRRSEEIGIVDIMGDDDKIFGWKGISDRMGWSIPTTVKRAINFKMPIIKEGGRVWTREIWIKEWEAKRNSKYLIWKT